MSITKIHLTVDKKDYTGLYWVSENRGKCYVNVSFADLKNISSQISRQHLKDAEQDAKNLLHALISNMH